MSVILVACQADLSSHGDALRARRLAAADVGLEQADSARWTRCTRGAACRWLLAYFNSGEREKERVLRERERVVCSLLQSVDNACFIHHLCFFEFHSNAMLKCHVAY